MRIVHYINQFFAGIGGEDQASISAGFRPEPVGPAMLLQRLVSGQAEVVGTVWCGDNYFVGRRDQATAEVLDLIRDLRPDIVVAGPAFNAGRYGPACAWVCRAVQEQLGIPTVTAMSPENPGAELEGRGLIIMPTGDSAAQMGRVMPKVAAMALKLGRGEALGPAEQEGYLPRGIRRNILAEKPGSTRAVDLLLEKIAGHPFRSEVPMPKFENVTPAPPIKDLRQATIALVTEGGLVPKGNPDRLESARATKWLSYSLAGVSDLTADSHETVHGGIDQGPSCADPDRILPVDVMRELAAEGVFGRLHETYYVTVGNNIYLTDAVRYGKEIAAKLRECGVEGVVLPST